MEVETVADLPMVVEDQATTSHQTTMVVAVRFKLLDRVLEGYCKSCLSNCMSIQNKT
jgi:hypothetical protein